jgi:phosphohistidine phosphatase
LSPRGAVELYLLRHAHAGDPEAWQGPDEQRPLSSKGKRQSERLGRFLSVMGFKPAAVITSPKLRASQTAEIVADRLDLSVAADDDLAGPLSLSTIEAILDRAGRPASVVLVGHDPDFSELLGELIGSQNVPMKKGALARIDAERPLSPGTGTLRWLIPPDLLTADL